MIAENNNCNVKQYADNTKLYMPHNNGPVFYNFNMTFTMLLNGQTCGNFFQFWYMWLNMQVGNFLSID